MFEETSQLGLKNKYKFVPKGYQKSQIKNTVRLRSIP